MINAKILEYFFSFSPLFMIYYIIYFSFKLFYLIFYPQFHHFSWLESSQNQESHKMENLNLQQPSYPHHQTFRKQRIKLNISSRPMWEVYSVKTKSWNLYCDNEIIKHMILCLLSSFGDFVLSIGSWKLLRNSVVYSDDKKIIKWRAQCN